MFFLFFKALVNYAFFLLLSFLDSHPKDDQATRGCGEDTARGQKGAGQRFETAR